MALFGFLILPMANLGSIWLPQFNVRLNCVVAILQPVSAPQFCDMLSCFVLRAPQFRFRSSCVISILQPPSTAYQLCVRVSCAVAIL